MTTRDRPHGQSTCPVGRMVTTTLLSTRRMLFLVLAVAVARQSTGQTGAPKPFAPPETGLVLIRNAGLIDGTGGALRTGMDVLIRGERIERVFPDANVDHKLLAEAKVVAL